MKHPLKQTNMLTEARSLGKGHGWGIEILIFLLVFFVAQMLQAIPLSIATVVWIFTNDTVMTALLQGDVAEYMESITALTTNMPDSLMLVQLFSTLLTTVAAILFCRLIEKRTATSMGLQRGNILSEYLVGSAVGIALMSLCVGLCALFGGLTLSTSRFSVAVWLLYLVGFLIQGMSEEVLCRGYMMISVSRKNALWLAVMTNSVMFALLHIANPGFGILPFINITLFGVLESVYVLKRGNLWGASAIHSLWNFFQGNVFGISVSGTGTGASPLSASFTEGMAWLNGGTFGLEGGVIVTAVIALAALAVIFLMPTKQSEIAPSPEAASDATHA